MWSDRSRPSTGRLFLDSLANTTGVVLGVLLPYAALYGATWFADVIAERRRRKEGKHDLTS